MWDVPDPRTFDSLIDLIEDAAKRWAGREQMALRTDDGLHLPWTAADVNRHSKLVAWRLRRLGLQPGDRLLTWSPSTPALPAVYFGAMRARVVIVPLDLRMAPDVLQRIAERSDAKWLAVGTGLDAPDPQAGGLEHLNIRTVDWLAAEPAHENAFADRRGRPRRPIPDRLGGAGRRLGATYAQDLFEVIYTSGTTGNPKGVMLQHGTILSTLEAIAKILPPREHRTVSLLPPSHLFEQAPILMFGTMIGAHILLVRSRTPRVIFEALREERVTTMVLVPQLLELFWLGLEREVKRQGKEKTFNRAQRIARFLPYWARRLIFRSVHQQLGGALNLMVSAGAYLPPALQQGWEDLGVIVLQGYGATECGPVVGDERERPSDWDGRPQPGAGEAAAGGGNERDPDRRPDRLRGLLAGPRRDGRGQDRRRLVPHRRCRPVRQARQPRPHGPDQEHHRPAQRLQRLPGGHRERPVRRGPRAGRGHRDQTRSSGGRRSLARRSAGHHAQLACARAAQGPNRRWPPCARESSRSSAPPTRGLSQQQRLDDFRIWPEADFPRTHTLKIKRSEVQKWAGADAHGRSTTPTEKRA